MAADPKRSSFGALAPDPCILFSDLIRVPPPHHPNDASLFFFNEASIIQELAKLYGVGEVGEGAPAPAPSSFASKVFATFIRAKTQNPALVPAAGQRTSQHPGALPGMLYRNRSGEEQ